MSNYRLLFVFLLFNLLLPTLYLPQANAQEESMTVTTYYPSPYGSYNSLQTGKLGVGDNNGDSSLTSADVPTTPQEMFGLRAMSASGRRIFKINYRY